uniref:DNA-directed RNA polymerase subunit n=1 Tax=Kalanchoe fedtschenkoi TaxID=63787 RepID=A0A7N0TX24_KALFE
MNNDLLEEQSLPTASVTRLHFGLLKQEVVEKFAVFEINQASEVSDPRLGFPNLSNECSTCGGKVAKNCEGHYGVVQFPCTILHPYFVSEIVRLLNKVCPACKSVRKDAKAKAADAKIKRQRLDCKYCGNNKVGWYPPMKFKVSSHDIFKRTTIMVEASENVPKKYQNKIPKLPDDYWSFIPDDGEEQDITAKPNRKVLTHAQVHHLLESIDIVIVKQHIAKIDSLFLNSALVTPNSHRITEVTHAFSDSQTLMFDERTRAYKKLVDFRGKPTELGSRFHECLKLSKLSSEKTSVSGVSGSKYIKEIILGKRTDFSFRMVVVGDPKIKLSEIGIPCRIAERLQVSERITHWNWEKLSAYCQLKIFEKGELLVRRNNSLVQVHRLTDCRAGDIIYRPLSNGDTLLINRPPSIHQHSLIALSAKILPMNSVLSINPLCCSPLRGDFDGDCLHGYIPQSVNCRVELEELIALDKQLTDGQSGRNLLSLSQDSLTAAFIVLDDDVMLTRTQMQQLAMFNPHQLPSPAIFKSPLKKAAAWTGMQLFSMLLPGDLKHSFQGDCAQITDGDLIYSSRTYSWLRDPDDNLYRQLIKHGKSSPLKFLYDAQDVLSEWFSIRGFSVSLADMYLTPDCSSRQNMVEEVRCGLREADQTSQFRQLMVDGNRDLMSGRCHRRNEEMINEAEAASIERQKSAALCQASVYAFKKVFADIQNLTYQYASKDNSILAMVKSGSKGNMQKLVQHSMCLGLQHSMLPLSFRFPHQLTCEAWNNQKKANDAAESYIPYAVIESSYLSGLNPVECFVHSVTSRQSSFSDNADLPGTLTRKLMFLLRDYCMAYDGTVRNSYGNQVAQFTYDVDDSIKHDDDKVVAGQPVGSLAACAVSEAAYSALDQPVSLLEASPLLNIKKVLECGSSRSTGDQTVSLFLSKKLGRHRHGFEYGALEVKSHLEILRFSDIVTSVQINFQQPSGCWVCHFHARKEFLKTRRLNLRSIIEALQNRCFVVQGESKFYLPTLQISCTRECSDLRLEKSCDDLFCLSIAFEGAKTSSLGFDAIRDVVVPLLLETVIKGFPEIKKVDVLWKDGPRVPKFCREASGELYLTVALCGDSGRKKFWNILLDCCLPVMDLIDWERSHPDNVHAIFSSYGVDSAMSYFVKTLNSAVSETGKAILPKHLLLVANSLSLTGEFAGLSAAGMAKQRAAMEVSTPFVQACFSGPAECFVKAAKTEVVDSLEGSIDALAWGNTPPVGTGAQFEILFSQQGCQVDKPTDVYSLLGGKDVHHNEDAENKLPTLAVPAKLFRDRFTFSDVVRLYDEWKYILHKTRTNHLLNDSDREAMLMALRFHPSKNVKIGSGVKEIKVGYHPVHKVRCFFVIRTDGSEEDFSFRKCTLGALQIIHPKAIRIFKSKWQRAGTE